MLRAAGLALLLVLCAVAPAAAAPALVALGSFASPTWAGAPPSEPSRVFVAERAGRVRVIDDGVVQSAAFLDITPITESRASEQGLLSVDFAPDYATSGLFYVYMTVRAAASESGTAGEIQIREYRRSAVSRTLADPRSGRLLLAIRHSDDTNHNGGQVRVGPDGKLWLATGDGGGGNDQYGHAQNRASRLGKLLRLDPVTGAVEQLAQGLRNPWRFSFTPAGEIVIADVGQNRYEEVNVGLGANYGWPCREGMHDWRSDPGCQSVELEDPVLEKTHSGDLFCSITGGVVVRDPGLPTLLGRYLYGDFCASPLRSFALDDPAGDAAVGLSVQSLSSIGEDACNRVLVVSLNGPVYRLADSAPTPCGGPAPTPSPAAPAAATATPFATASPAPAPTPPATSARVRDLRPCVVSLRVTGLASLGRRGYLTVALRADEPCRARVSGRMTAASFRPLTVRVAPAVRTVIRLRATRPRAVARVLRTRPRTVALRISTTDAAGNRGTLTARERAPRRRGPPGVVRETSLAAVLPASQSDSTPRIIPLRNASTKRRWS